MDPAVDVAPPGVADADTSDDPQAGESFEQTMARIAAEKGEQFDPSGLVDQEPGEDAEEPEPAAAAEEDTAEADGDEAAEAADGEPTEEEQLRELLDEVAERLGMAVDGKTVSAREAAKWRKVQSEQKRALRALEEKTRTEIETMRAEAEQDIQAARNLLAVKESGDYQKLAKELGYENWNDLQKAVMAQVSDPHWQRIRALEEQAEQHKKEAAERAQEAQQRELTEKQERARQNIYKANVDLMESSEDPLLKAMAGHPLLSDAIYAIQKQEWDGQSYPDPDEALDMSIEGVDVSVREELQDLYQRLRSAFEAEEEDEEESEPAESPRPVVRNKKRPAPRTSSQRRAPVEPAVSKAPEDENAFRSYALRKLAEAGLRE